MWPQSSTAKEPFPSAEVKWVCSCNKCIYYMWYSEWILPPPPYLTPGPLALETKQNSDQGSLPEVGRCADRKPPAVSLLLDRERRKLKAASSSFMTCRFVVIHDLKADKRSLRVKDSFLMQTRTDKKKKKKKKNPRFESNRLAPREAYFMHCWCQRGSSSTLGIAWESSLRQLSIQKTTKSENC